MSADAMLKAHAVIVASSARAMIEALGMHALNMQREALGHSMAYSDEAFMSVIESNHLGENDVAVLLKTAGES